MLLPQEGGCVPSSRDLDTNDGAFKWLLTGPCFGGPVMFFVLTFRQGFPDFLPAERSRRAFLSSYR